MTGSDRRSHDGRLPRVAQISLKKTSGGKISHQKKQLQWPVSHCSASAPTSVQRQYVPG
jgi:hypothetical protein